MKIPKNRLLGLSMLFFVGFSISCADHESEKRIALGASDDFYQKFQETVSMENLSVDFLADGKDRTRLLEKLKIIKEAVGEISGRKLRKTETGLRESTVFVDCSYELKAVNRVFLQNLRWHVSEQSTKLVDVTTYTLDDQGQVNLIVSDGKIIF